MIASLMDENSEDVTLMSEIKANTPYVVSLHRDSEPGVARFVSGKCEVARTPSEIRQKAVDMIWSGHLFSHSFRHRRHIN